MEVSNGSIPGILIIQLSPIQDERGSFTRTYDVDLMRKAGVHREWVQENRSRNTRSGIIRGMHFQFPPHAESKLVQCTSGEIFDVFVDLRSGSPTFCKWGSVVLSGANNKMLLIPKGFAHGYCTISELSEVSYKVDNVYHPSAEGGLLWSDPEIGIEWPLKGEPSLSEKDQRHMTLKQFIAAHQGLRHPGSTPA